MSPSFGNAFSQEITYGNLCVLTSLIYRLFIFVWRLKNTWWKNREPIITRAKRSKNFYAKDKLCKYHTKHTNFAPRLPKNQLKITIKVGKSVVKDPVVLRTRVIQNQYFPALGKTQSFGKLDENTLKMSSKRVASLM